MMKMGKRLTKLVEGKYVENHDNDSREWSNGNRACMTKLAAYENEEEERENGCDYCNKRQILIRYGAAVYIDDGRLALNNEAATAYKMITYCPMCGKKLVG